MAGGVIALRAMPSQWFDQGVGRHEDEHLVRRGTLRPLGFAFRPDHHPGRARRRATKSRDLRGRRLPGGARVRPRVRRSQRRGGDASHRDATGRHGRFANLGSPTRCRRWNALSGWAGSRRRSTGRRGEIKRWDRTGHHRANSQANSVKSEIDDWARLYPPSTPSTPLSLRRAHNDPRRPRTKSETQPSIGIYPSRASHSTRAPPASPVVRVKNLR